MSAIPLRPVPLRLVRLVWLGLALGLSAGVGHASDDPHASPPPKPAHAKPSPTAAHAPADKEAKPTVKPAASGDPQAVVDRIRTALAKQADQNKLHVLVGDEPIVPKTPASAHAAAHPAPARKASASHGAAKSLGHAQVQTAALVGHAAPTAHGGEVHWDYAGEHGPEHWGQMKPEFNACAIGQRQTPIHIQSSQTLQGPAEPLQFAYGTSNASVVNNGHTVQVDVDGENTLTVRGSTYRLLQFHFHHPSEERVNHKSFAMVAHLVHRNDMGQLAVVAVLIDPGEANALIQKVWTHMPLDTNDRVRLPDGLIDLRELLPQDQRYYQFMGSLTTPPCTEGVLWMVMKQPVGISREQLRLFAQLFPMNARPVQAVNGRPVREGM